MSAIPILEHGQTDDRPAIIFDHYRHEGKYFQQQGQAFNCSQCHALDENNEPISTVSFEEGCADCHQPSMDVSLDHDLAVLSLPTLDVEVFEREGLAIGEWPQEFVGDFDGVIPPLMYLLLRSDPLANSALEQFGPAIRFLGPRH